jgi:ACS family glucarate transporter-like MFS transporter
VRWLIVALLSGISITSYLQRMNISIAARFMMPELGLTQIQMGRVFSSFLIGYTIFQIPTGILGDRRGPRLILALSAVSWGVMTVLTGLAPGILLTGTAALTGLMVIRFILGVGEASTYPVAALGVARWSPVSERALAQAIVVGGLSVGSTITPPLIALLMVKVGWRESFYLVSAVAFVIALLWWTLGGDDPATHPRVNAAERALILAGRSDVHRFDWRALGRVFRDRNVALISLSYFFSGYIFYIFIFWLYTYLTDVRGFSVLKGGFYASLPYIMSSVLTPAGGATSDWLLGRVSRTWARRIPAIVGLTLAGLCMIFGAMVSNPYLAIAGLALSIGFDQFAEPEFWAATMDVAGSQSGTATGILNMMGNLGGVVSTSMVPILVAKFGWIVALGSGTLFAFVGALIWFTVRCDRPILAPSADAILV